MAELKAGDAAPEVSLEAGGGGTVSLKDFRGKKRVVLYFYPKDNTPGCTTEACGFRDRAAKLRARAAVVLGVSPDSAASHERFAAKFSLPFALLSDPERKACLAYGVWVQKSLYGRQYMGVERSTFVIGKDGTIERVFRRVKAAEHPKEVLDHLSGRGAAASSTVGATRRARNTAAGQTAPAR